MVDLELKAVLASRDKNDLPPLREQILLQIAGIVEKAGSSLAAQLRLVEHRGKQHRETRGNDNRDERQQHDGQHGDFHRRAVALAGYRGRGTIA